MRNLQCFDHSDAKTKEQLLYDISARAQIPLMAGMHSNLNLYRSYHRNPELNKVVESNIIEISKYSLHKYKLFR